ncbi:MAG: DegT/DnrJ/EryC1/StrS family aminotransferase [Gammaproteobacteria bacterium]
MERIPFLRPTLVEADSYLPLLRDIDAAHLYSNFGPLNARFEQRVLAEYFGGAGGVSTAGNATLGLMLAIKALARPGARYALMPSFTFAATPLSATWCGLEPWFVDIDPRTWCMDESALASALAKLGDAVAVVVPYPAFATHASLATYASLHRDGIPVVVDAAPSFGTSLDGRQYGAGFPGAVVYSFHATKAFGVGEGGMVYSADAELVQKIRRLSNFGFNADRVPEGDGINAKISEYTAAIALATLDAFPGKLAARREVLARYRRAIAASTLPARGWQLQATQGDVATQIFSLLVPPGLDADALIARLDAAGIELRRYFRPACHQQAHFSRCGRGDLPVTEEVARRIVNLPFWEGMGEERVNRVVSELEANSN